MAKAIDKTRRIAALNDKFRKEFGNGGRVFMTAGVNAKGAAFVAKALIRAGTFSEFNAGNDAHKERDFGAFELDGEKLFFKIDYYDLKAEFGSEDASDPKKTLRVLTVMLAEEY